MRRHLELLCRELGARGVAVRVAAPTGFSMASSLEFLPAEITARASVGADLRAARDAAGYARDADLIHGHGLRGAWIAGLAAWKTGKPFLFTAHNLAPTRMSRISRFALAWTAEQAAGIIAVSEAVAESLVRCGIARESITVIPNGIDLALYDFPMAESNNRATILGIGRLSPEKGFPTLIEAMALILKHQPEAALVLAGEGPERERLNLLASTFGLESRVSMPGFVEDVAELLADAAVVAIPSLEEGQGIVALEAMAAGVPVVATQVGGLMETITHEETGLLVPASDPATLADAILRFLRDDSLRNRLVAAARKRVEDQYTVGKMVDRTAGLYGQTLKA